MPLKHSTLTPAERITLPLYASTFLLLGATLLAQEPRRTSGHAFDPARVTLGWLPIDPMSGWGLLFLAIGLVESTVLTFQGRRRVYIRALDVGAGLAAFWMVMLFAAALTSPDVSFTSGEWLLIPVVGQIASARMLASREPAR